MSKHQRNDKCDHNYISLEITLPSKGKTVMLGLAFNDEHVDSERQAMWWDAALGELKQAAMETLEREGIFESVEL